MKEKCNTHFFFYCQKNNLIYNGGHSTNEAIEMLIKKLILPVLGALFLQGCISVNPVGPLNPPLVFIEKPVAAKVMVDDVVVSDTTMKTDAQQGAGKVLTNEISQYIERAGYFNGTLSYPAKLGDKDVKLQFEFDNLRAKRKPHPGYFPGAILTLTMWIWVNGPIYVDDINLSCKLKIVDANGSVVASSEKTAVVEQNVGLWDQEYMGGVGSRQLESLIKDALDDATMKLKASMKVADK